MLVKRDSAFGTCLTACLHTTHDLGHHDGTSMNQPMDRIYHVSHRGKRFGPLSLVELSNRILTHDMLVWREDLPNWVPIGELPELLPYVRHAASNNRTTPPAQVPPPAQVALAKRAPLVPPPPLITPPELLPSPPRSAVATTFGVLGVIGGSLGLICSPFAIAGALAAPQDGPLLFANNPEFQGLRILGFIAGFLLSIPLLIGGIGLIKRKAWGRVTALVCSIAGIVLHVFSAAIVWAYVVLPTFGLAGDIGSGEAMGEALGVSIIASAEPCIGLVYHILTIVSLRLQSVKRSLS